MTDMTRDEAVEWLRDHVGDLRSAARVLRESPWGAKLAATATEVDKAADEATLAIAALEAARVERDALREALKDLIAWFPSAGTYQRLGFNPEAPMRAFEKARAALKQEKGGSDVPEA